MTHVPIVKLHAESLPLQYQICLSGEITT